MKNIDVVGVTEVSWSDEILLTIDRWLVLFNKKCLHDSETERVIVCIYDFCFVIQDFSCEFCIMSCVQVRFGSA